MADNSDSPTLGAVVLSTIGAFGFGFWMESGGAGVFMCVVLLFVMLVIDGK